MEKNNYPGSKKSTQVRLRYWFRSTNEDLAKLGVLDRLAGGKESPSHSEEATLTVPSGGAAVGRDSQVSQNRSGGPFLFCHCSPLAARSEQTGLRPANAFWLPGRGSKDAIETLEWPFSKPSWDSIGKPNVTPLLRAAERAAT